MLFQCLVFSLTVKYQCNEVLPGCVLRTLNATPTRGEISIFSCWQSIYLPSDVEYVCGMNPKRRGNTEKGRKLEMAVYVPALIKKWAFEGNCTTLHGSLH